MKEHMTIAEAADFLDVSPKTIRRMIASRILTGYRLGNTRLIRLKRDEVNNLLRPMMPPKGKERG